MAHPLATARTSAQMIVPVLVELLQPKSVIDIGCGDGTWLSVFQDCGVSDILGVDSAGVDPDRFVISRAHFLPFDLSRPFVPGRQFDLTLCLEVAHRMCVSQVKQFLRSLTRLSPVLLFSAAIPFQEGILLEAGGGHWPEYWAECFQTEGFEVIDCLRKCVWQDAYVDWRYAQNLLLFARRDYVEAHARLREELQLTNRSQLALVHPRHYEEVVQRVGAGQSGQVEPAGEVSRQAVDLAEQESQLRQRHLELAQWSEELRRGAEEIQRQSRLAEQESQLRQRHAELAQWSEELQRDADAIHQTEVRLAEWAEELHWAELRLSEADGPSRPEQPAAEEPRNGPTCPPAVAASRFVTPIPNRMRTGAGPVS